MSDDPNKIGADRKTVSEQDYEINYLKKKLAQGYPEKSEIQIEEAIGKAKAAIHPSTSRDEIEAHIQKQFS